MLILGALVFCLHVYLCEGIGAPGIRVTDSCELLCGCWELNPGLLEELLTTEPSLQPPETDFTSYCGHDVSSQHQDTDRYNDLPNCSYFFM